MDFTDQEVALVLAGLFELTITHVEDDEKRERCKALARKLGGDPDAMFFERSWTGEKHDPVRASTVATAGAGAFGSGITTKSEASGLHSQRRPLSEIEQRA